MSQSTQPSLALEAETFFPDGAPPAFPLWSEEDHPWSAALVEHTVTRYSAGGDLVLDPFAGQPVLAHAAAPTQRRLLLSHFSPASVVALRAAAAPPPPAVLDAAFAKIADAPRRGRTLADYLRSLYETVCPDCAQNMSADYFVWDQGAGEPVLKGYRCPHCQSAGQAPTDLADGDLAAGLELRGAAYWGLLSRLVAPGDPLTTLTRSLIDLYTPRALLALSELVTATDQRLVEPEERQAAQALVLHAMQRCISLRDKPVDAATADALALPNQLQVPQRFVEYNVWQAFEHAYRTLRGRSRPNVRTAADAPALLGPAGAGSVLFLSAGVQALGQHLGEATVALILSSPPRLSPTSYALNFLWSGWLFGRKVAEPLKPTLEVRTATWDWYTRVLGIAMRSLRRLLRPEGHLVMAFGSPSTRLAWAVIVAASQAGLRLVAQATQTSSTALDDLTRWRLVFAVAAARPIPPSKSTALLAGQLRTAAQEAAQELVAARSEPTPAALVETAAAVRWAADGLLVRLSQHEEASQKPLSFLAQHYRLALSADDPPAGLRLHEAADGAAPAQWAPEPPVAALPLADRVEQFIADRLATAEVPQDQVAAAVYAAFPGWQTPDTALIDACIASYAVIVDGLCRLRDEDRPERRAHERGEILLRLHALGRRLGYAVWVALAEHASALGLAPVGDGGPSDEQVWAPAGLVWHEQGRPAYAFAISFHAALHPWLAPPTHSLADCPRCVVLPGGRAGLLAFKLQRTPAWRELLAEAGWEFVKFRHVRQLSAQSDLTLAGFRARLSLDPILTLPGAQLSLFETPLNGDAHAH